MRVGTIGLALQLREQEKGRKMVRGIMGLVEWSQRQALNAAELGLVVGEEISETTIARCECFQGAAVSYRIQLYAHKSKWL